MKLHLVNITSAAAAMTKITASSCISTLPLSSCHKTTHNSSLTRAQRPPKHLLSTASGNKALFNQVDSRIPRSSKV